MFLINPETGNPLSLGLSCSATNCNVYNVPAANFSEKIEKEKGNHNNRKTNYNGITISPHTF